MTALGYYNANNKCVASSFWNECETTSDLEAQAKKLGDEIAQSAGINDYEKKVKLAELEAQLKIRRIFGGNDKAADQNFDNIVGSDMFNLDFNGKGNSDHRLKYLERLNRSLSDGLLGKDEITALGNFMHNYRISIDDAGRPVFYYTGGGTNTDWNSSQLGTFTIDLPGGNGTYLQGNANIFSSIFGKSDQSAVLGFMTMASNGFTSSRNGAKRTVNSGFSYSDFSKMRLGNMKSGKSNSIRGLKGSEYCDLGLSKPQGFSMTSVYNSITSDPSGVITQPTPIKSEIC